MLAVTKPEEFTAHYLITGNRGTPVPLDVFNNEIRTLEVPSLILMEGVRQIAAQ